MKNVEESIGFVLMTKDGNYLCETNSEWGPSHIESSFQYATFFEEDENFNIRYIEKCWGAKLKAQKAKLTITKEIL